MALLIGIVALFASAHSAVPATLFALVCGILLSFLYSKHHQLQRGVQWSSGFVLRVGVALLGLRIAFGDVAALGWGVLAMIGLAIITVILIGVLGARLLGLRSTFGVLSGGAVSICGASAAMALHSVLPKHQHSERDLNFALIGITAFSTLEMVVYPFLAQGLGLNAVQTGLFLGGTIHDVAQTAGAGFAVSDEVGEVAVLTKMIRVSFLVPVVLAVALLFRAQAGDANKHMPAPAFLIVFFAFMLANSVLPLPVVLTDMAGLISKVALITAMAAIGLKSDLRGLFAMGVAPIALISSQVLLMSLLVFGFVFIL